MKFLIWFLYSAFVHVYYYYTINLFINSNSYFGSARLNSFNKGENGFI